MHVLWCHRAKVENGTPSLATHGGSTTVGEPYVRDIAGVARAGQAAIPLYGWDDGGMAVSNWLAIEMSK
jgi:hypothetical protein